MKKATSIILVFVLIISILTIFSGCTSDMAKTLTIVLGNNKNAPIINMNSTAVYNQIHDTMYTMGTVNVVVADGNPFIYTTYSINLTTNVDAQKKRQLANEWTTQICNECTDAIPKTKEIDLIEALFVAAEALSNATGEKELLISSSGLSTAGILNFAKQPYLKDMTPSTIIERLKDAHAIPDLTNTNIVWVGFGKTAGLQDRLSKENEYKLKEIWTEILYAGGAKNVTFQAGEFTNDNTDNMPYVTPVVFDDKDIFPEESFVKLDTISFVSDTAQFIDREAAIEALSPFAAYLNNNPEKIILAGMTATVQHSDGVKLSTERANACKEILIEEFGVNENLIITIGLGSKPNSLRKKDTNSSGVLIEELAQENRAVYVCIYDSDIGCELSGIA